MLDPPLSPLSRSLHFAPLQSARLQSARRCCSALVFLIGGLLGPTAISQEPSGQWIRATSEHFTVISAAGPHVAQQTAEDLEMLHSVLANLAGADPQSPIPTKVFLFPNGASMRPFNPASSQAATKGGRAVAGGFFAQRPLANYVAINLSTSRAARDVIQHEYLHYFATHNLPRLPFWFNEGLAEYYSTFYVVDGVGYVGKPVDSRIAMLTETSHEFAVGWRQLERLAGIRSVADLDDGNEALLSYARSWAVVHYLLSDDERTEKTMDFMRELTRGTDPQSAFEDSFDQPLESFSRPLNRYLAEGDFRLFRTSVSSVDAPALVELSMPEVAVALGELAFAVGNHGGARQLFESALDDVGQGQYSPEQQATVTGLADLGLAQLALAAEDPLLAVELARSAVNRVPSVPDSWVVFGLAHQMAAPPNPTDAERAEMLATVRRAYESGLERNPDLPVALLLHGATWIDDPLSSVSHRAKKQLMVAPDYVQPAIRSLRHEQTVSPHGTEGTKSLSKLLTLGGHFNQGLALLFQERPRFSDEQEWLTALEKIGEVEARQLLEQLQHGPEAPSLALPELETLTQRVDVLELAIDRYGEFSFLVTAAQEIRRLHEIETLWTMLATAQASAEPDSVTEARRTVEHVLDVLNRNPGWEGPRVVNLEQAATVLYQRLSL